MKRVLRRRGLKNQIVTKCGGSNWNGSGWSGGGWNGWMDGGRTDRRTDGRSLELKPQRRQKPHAISSPSVEPPAFPFNPQAC